MLSNLCWRFLNRKLYKYVTIDHPDETWLSELAELMPSIGLDPIYHMEIDYPFDLPYDVYRPDQKKGEKGGKAPILLLDHEGGISEISVKSDIVRSITGLHQGEYRLYFPEEPLLLHKHLLSEKIIQALHLT
ncbi:hypothetical protein D3C78_1595150 [compost metagenome]